jgi:hypothetical protein
MDKPNIRFPCQHVEWLTTDDQLTTEMAGQVMVVDLGVASLNDQQICS